jgi:hypothetical protein
MFNCEKVSTIPHKVWVESRQLKKRQSRKRILLLNESAKTHSERAFPSSNKTQKVAG